MSEQTMKVIALRPFLVAPGLIARVGEVYEVEQSIARNAVAKRYADVANPADNGKAEDAARMPEAPPFTATHRDPTVRRRRE